MLYKYENFALKYNIQYMIENIIKKKKRRNLLSSLNNLNLVISVTEYFHNK